MTDLFSPDTPAVKEYATVYVAWELSKASWKLGIVVPGVERMSGFAVKGGDLAAVAARLAAARAKAARSGLPVRVLSCYEAGFDGRWLHRWLEGQGVISHEVDPSSIEVNRRARRAKTDRLDLARIMRAFLAHLRGEPQACSVVHVPSPEEEDEKRANRERERLITERTAHTNRLKGLLHAQGIRDVKPLARDFPAHLENAHTGDGRRLPPRLAAEIAREHERLILLERQIAAIEAAREAECREAARPTECGRAAAGSSKAKIVRLTQLKAIGVNDAQTLVNEVFYRRFANRRQVGACVGLTGTPFSSGAAERDQGISKAGNRRARTTAIELAWRSRPLAERQRAHPMVQGAHRRPQGPAAAHRHRRRGPQADRRAVALSRNRRRPRGRRASPELLTGAADHAGRQDRGQTCDRPHPGARPRSLRWVPSLVGRAFVVA